jgi:hypothetical protein
MRDRSYIQVTSRGGSKGYETSTLPQFLDNQLTDGGEVGLTVRLPFPARKIPDTLFLLETQSTPGP